MSDHSFDDGADGDDILAAEYALGVLDGAARTRTERRIRTDAVFAAKVADWEARLSPMVAAVPSVAPDAALWAGIEADLNRIARVRRPHPVAEPPLQRGRMVPAFWRWFGLGSFGLLTASLAALLVVTQPRPGLAPLTASLAGESGPPLYTAVVYPGSHSATLVPVSVGAADPAHSHELWLIEPEKAPLSLGVLQANGPLRIEISPELLATGGILAISLEPAGGSPTGQPTGPVVAKGELQAI